MKKTLLVLAVLFSFSANIFAANGDSVVVQCFKFSDPSPKGWGAYYKGVFQFPDDNRSWSKILMVKTLKCDSATNADKWLCGEWDYITKTNIWKPVKDTFELFELCSFITPYGIRLDLTSDGWEWVWDVTDYAPLLKGEIILQSGNNQELLDLKFIFIEGTPPRDVISVENIWPSGRYIYEDLALDSSLSKKKIILNDKASSFQVKARISGHGHYGPRNCCEWDSKTHSYYLGEWDHFRWTVWKDCGFNPIYPQGGTWPFDRAGWCPGTAVEEHTFSLDGKAWPGDTIEFDYGIEMFRENGEKKGDYHMAHQLFTYGPINHKHDVEVYDVISPNNKDRYRRANSDCDVIKIVIRNNGSVPLTDCIIEYKDDTQKKFKVFEWKGYLTFGQLDTVIIPKTFEKRLKEKKFFYVQVSSPNRSVDENLINNTYKTIVPVKEILPETFDFVLETNDKERARDIQWYLLNEQGGVIEMNNEELLDDSTYTYTFQLDPGCYQLIIIDKVEDGMNRHWWNRVSDPDQVGKNGRLRLLNSEGGLIKEFPYDFGEGINYNFIVK